MSNTAGGTPGWLLSALLIALAGALAACGSSDAPAPTATATPAEVQTGTPVQSLREVDFSSVGLAGVLIDLAGGGEVPAERVQFLDLTGDGMDEAVVVVESGGTLGDLGVGVYRLAGGAPVLEFFTQAGGRVEVRVGVVVVQSGVYEAGDAQCCPSRLRESGFAWDGEQFVRISEQVVDNPAR